MVCLIDDDTEENSGRLTTAHDDRRQAPADDGPQRSTRSLDIAKVDPEALGLFAVSLTNVIKPGQITTPRKTMTMKARRALTASVTTPRKIRKSERVPLVFGNETITRSSIDVL